MTGFLGKEDLRQLTGAARQGDQVAWLRENGFPCDSDEIAVQWDHVYAFIEGRPIVVSGKPAGLIKWEAEQAKRKREYEAWVRENEEASRAWVAANQDLIQSNRRAVATERAAKRRAAELQRTPSWADFAAIAEVYAQAQAVTRATGVQHHVDHVIPLQGRKVSGLHVHTNLQILTGSENCRKKNRYEP